MTDYLSREMYYPDCPECGRDGGLTTVKTTQDVDWACLKCGHAWDTDPDSTWGRYRRLPDLMGRCWFDLRIRDMDPTDVAARGGDGTNVDTATAKRLASSADNRL